MFVGAASRHRQAAFAAAEMLMDYLKSKAPFWKRPVLAGGVKADWVEAAASRRRGAKALASAALSAALKARSWTSGPGDDSPVNQQNDDRADHGDKPRS